MIGHLNVPETASLLTRWWRSTRVPLGLAIMFCVVATGVHLRTHGEALAKLGISFPALVATYLLGGLATGAIVLLSRDWTKTRARGAGLGFMTAVVLALLVMPWLFPPLSLIQTLKVVVLFGLILGAPLGAMYWSRRGS